MPIVALPLVFGEVARLEHLADVVEIGADAHQQAAGADRFGRRLGQRRHGDRMVVRARCAANQFLQQRMGRIAQLDQAQVGLHVENLLDHRQQARHQRAGDDGPNGPQQRQCSASA